MELFSWTALTNREYFAESSSSQGERNKGRKLRGKRVFSRVSITKHTWEMPESQENNVVVRLPPLTREAR